LVDLLPTFVQALDKKATTPATTTNNKKLFPFSSHVSDFYFKSGENLVDVSQQNSPVTA